MTARIAASHRSATARTKSPIHVTTIAPVDLGAQPTNQRLSPMVKWRYIIILPIFMDIDWSMLITMPLSWARALATKKVTRRVSRATRCMVCGYW
jgi:hypothetical protein